MRNFRKIGVLILFVLFVFSGCSVELVSGIDENEANKLLVVLAESNIKAKKSMYETDHGPLWGVIVKKRDFLRALQILKDNNLPGEKREGVLEIFGKKDFLPTQTAEKALEEYSQNAELAKTIEQIQGVVRARVHIARIKDELTGMERPVSASVLINYIANGEGAQPFSLDDIKKIIAGGVANMQIDNVSVIATPVLQKILDSAQSSSSLPSVFFLLCGIFVLIAGGVNFYLWNKFRVIVSLNNKGINAVSDKRETEDGDK